MSESKYVSQVKTIPARVEDVYRVLGNLQNLERVKDLIPQDKIQELEISGDAITMKVDGLGQRITIAIVDRVENDTLKFGAEGLPMDNNFWVQLKPGENNTTYIRLTLKADIPMMFKMMLDKKIQKGIDDAATMLTQFPYSQWL
ncbi:MAG: SRPBCC family protein [Paludibacteraceae bacterium]|jgi:carbon monoxide dehydrogenase subunit G|nr:SRPBCC family protein [Paludibacteraceae bacterium]MBR1717496.1 SRPBCC family protein [Paludibacteraceae bacterium]